MYAVVGWDHDNLDAFLCNQSPQAITTPVYNHVEAFFEQSCDCLCRYKCRERLVFQLFLENGCFSFFLLFLCSCFVKSKHALHRASLKIAVISWRTGKMSVDVVNYLWFADTTSLESFSGFLSKPDAFWNKANIHIHVTTSLFVWNGICFGYRKLWQFNLLFKIRNKSLLYIVVRILFIQFVHALLWITHLTCS